MSAQTPGQAGDGAWAEWYAADRSGRTLGQDFSESKYDAMRRAFLAGLAAQEPQPAPGVSEIRTCYCGMTATVVPGVFPHRDCDGSVPGEPDLADLQAGLADLESEIRDVTREIVRCRSVKEPCPFCEREIARAMDAIEVYVRDVTEHERTRPASGLAQAQEGLRNLADIHDALLEEILRGAGEDMDLISAPEDRAARYVRSLEAGQSQERPVPGLSPQPGYWLAVLADVTAERDKARAAETALRDGITGLAVEFRASADATRPSRKSEIEDELAIALRRLLED